MFLLSVSLFSLLVIFLPVKRLVVFYVYLVGGSLLAAFHYKSTQYLLSLNSDDHSIEEVAINLLLCYGTQLVISITLGYVLDLSRISRLLLILICLVPVSCRAAGMPSTLLDQLHRYCTPTMMLSFVYLPHRLMQLAQFVIMYLLRELPFAVQMYGWIPVLYATCSKVMLPMQFFIFWCLLFLVQLYNSVVVDSEESSLAEGWLSLLLSVIGKCCVSPMSLVGLSITVSYTSYTILTLTKVFLIGWEAFTDDNVIHHGWMEGFTLFLLALQAEVIELETPQREFLMSIIAFIVISSLIHSMFEVADPFLLLLGASRSKNICKHIRAMAVCTFLWMMPLYMTVRIFQYFDIDFWLMVVVSNCILTSVQVLGCMAVYGLFIFDAIQQKPWESLDDVVYYVKAGTRIVEFIVALFIMCYGFSNSLFGEWSFVNSAILVLHCYFNVWQRLQVGWKTYLLRREAARKISLLPTASPEQLRANNDVCSICIHEMNAACITPCNHLFHSACLRKWLYIQDFCPLCHQKLVLERNPKQVLEEGSTIE